MVHNFYNGLSEDLRNGLTHLNDGLVNGLFGTEETPNVLDVDVLNFIRIAGITNGIHFIALNNLVRKLKFYNIWKKCKMIYPIIGGTALTHKYSLINPLDTSAYLTFNGTWTHASTGIKPDNSVNSFANSNNLISAVLTLNSTHMSYYSRTQNLQAGAELGVNAFAPTQSFQMGLNYSGIGKFAEMYNQTAGSGRVVLANTNTLGFQLASRISGTDFRLYFNGFQVGATSTGTPVGTLSGANLQINGSNGATNHSTKECAFVSVGDGLTQEEALIYYNIVQQYQKILNRAV